LVLVSVWVWEHGIETNHKMCHLWKLMLIMQEEGQTEKLRRTSNMEHSKSIHIVNLDWYKKKHYLVLAELLLEARLF
jgi:hypothetical protein